MQENCFSELEARIAETMNKYTFCGWGTDERCPPSIISRIASIAFNNMLFNLLKQYDFSRCTQSFFQWNIRKWEMKVYSKESTISMTKQIESDYSASYEYFLWALFRSQWIASISGIESVTRTNLPVSL